MKGLEGRGFLVTGGGSDIGAACVTRLVGEGAYVAAVDVDQKALESAFSQLERGSDLLPKVGCHQPR